MSEGLRILDLYPLNVPRFDAWKRAQACIPRLKKQGAIDLLEYGIKVTRDILITDGCHRTAMIYHRLGNALVTGYVEDEPGYDSIVDRIVKERKQKDFTIKTFLAQCLQGLVAWEEFE